MLPGALVTSTLYVTLAIHELGGLLLVGYVLLLTVLQLVKDSSCPRTTHGLVSSLMESLVHWTSRCLDTRHLYEMTRSPDPRDLVTCCVQLLTTFYGIPLGMVSVMLCISYARPLPDPEVAGSGVGHSLPHSYV